MLEYFVKDNSIFMIILIAMIIGLTCYIVSNIKELRNQRKNGKPLDCDVIVISVLAALLVTFALVSMGVGIADARKLNYAAKHDAIARHYSHQSCQSQSVHHPTLRRHRLWSELLLTHCFSQSHCQTSLRHQR